MSNHAVPTTPLISVVVPTFKEEENVRPFLDRIRPVLEQIGPYEVIFCLDPSPDRTEQILLDEAQRDSRIGVLIFSRRFGQPAATIAGMLNCRADACVVIDIDLQDPPEVILELHRKLQEGYDVVSAKRRSRQDETLTKGLVANLWYKALAVSDVSIPPNTGDFRIVNRRVIEELRGLRESHGFLRGLVAMVGFRQTCVEYDRQQRDAGTSKYNRYFGSMKIGFNGIFGFSTYPLQTMLWSGCVIASLSVVMIFYMIFAKFYLGLDYPLGIPTITVMVLFLGGVQLIGMGILGEYIARIYDEVRQRPKFVVDRASNVTVIDPHGRGVERRPDVGGEVP